MNPLKLGLVLSAVSLVVAGCQSNPSKPLTQMDKAQVEQQILGKVHESCLRSRMEASSVQDFSTPGKYKLTIHRGPNAGTYAGNAVLDDTGSIRVSNHNGPYGSEFVLVFKTDGEKILMDRNPPHPAGKDYLWVNCP